MSIYKSDDEDNNMLSPNQIITSPNMGITSASPIYNPVNSPFYIDGGA